MKRILDFDRNDCEKSFTGLMNSYKDTVEVEKEREKNQWLALPEYFHQRALTMKLKNDWLAFQKAKEERSKDLIGCHCYFDLQGQKVRGAGVITDLYEKTVHIKTKLGVFIRKWETHHIRAYPKYVTIKEV